MAVGGRSGGPGGKTNVCAGDAAPVLAPTGPKNGSRDVLRLEAVPVVLVSPKLLEREDLKIESRSSKIRDFRCLSNPKQAKGARFGHVRLHSAACCVVVVSLFIATSVHGVRSMEISSDLRMTTGVVHYFGRKKAKIVVFQVYVTGVEASGTVAWGCPRPRWSWRGYFWVFLGSTQKRRFSDFMICRWSRTGRAHSPS
jgi:hypothetical protein